MESSKVTAADPASQNLNRPFLLIGNLPRNLKPNARDRVGLGGGFELTVRFQNAGEVDRFR